MADRKQAITVQDKEGKDAYTLTLSDGTVQVQQEQFSFTPPKVDAGEFREAVGDLTKEVPHGEN